MKNRLLLTGILSILLSSIVPAQQTTSKPVIPENFCILENELLLANKINEYRLQNNLPPIPFSASLFYVAQTHVKDLARNHPDVMGCNQHSWSDKGYWKPCCYGKDSGKTSCMTGKPKELTGYRGKGYEMIYWDSEEALPSDVLELWKSIPQTNEMLLNQVKWKTKVWKSCGVGIFNGYAAVWLGDANDQLHGIRLCMNDSVLDLQAESAKLNTAKRPQKNIAQPAKENINPEFIAEHSSGEDRYYLIISSCKTIEQGGNEVAKFRRKGYQDARIIGNDSLFRVALMGYDSYKEAQKALNKLTSTFKGIWIYKY